MTPPSKRILAALVAASLMGAATGAAAAPTLAPSPSLPTYGQAVKVELLNTDWPLYLPATRYTRSGNTITIDYEYVTDGYGPARPDFGYIPLSLGELPPGNYAVQARMFDIRNPDAAPLTVSRNVPVVPPSEWGVYTVPMQPDANQPVDVLVRSAAYFDPGTMKVAVSGNVIRVDFDYMASAPAAGATPPGMTTFGSVRVGGLVPGNYRVEAWGRPTTGGASERYFTRDFAAGTQAEVVEFYHATLDHYFVAAGADEVAALDAGGGGGGWKRTGQIFKAWGKAGDAPPSAHPVCRFYASGPNSHFYTGDAGECAQLKALEQSGRAQAASQGTRFTGWGYEGIAFYALVPQNGRCAAGSNPVYRAYNNRAAQGDSNHRFTIDPMMRSAMQMGWLDEGAAFCSPG